ncbi:MAG: DNA polymerase III subunit gamma/tau [Acidobacteriota bacterium]
MGESCAPPSGWYSKVPGTRIMTYQVLALKWRPQKFEDVVGQGTVTATLVNAIKSGRIAHAFLFSGIRGVGKTTTARILAKALNCHKGLTHEPCGECISCREISESGSLDVLEIDAASNRGIENIREIRESVRYGTSRDRHKIFIIDEVHMLTKEAFNALLKTLEEPPSHVKFILATTERHRIPVTITSRCQEFFFKPIPAALLLDRLKGICREEGVEIAEYGLSSIVSTAEGSMRDAQSTLEQIVAFAGNRVSDEDVRTLLGTVDEKVVSQLVGAVLERDREALLNQVQDLIDSGVDPQNLIRRFIRYIRDLLILKVAGWDERLLGPTGAEKDILIQQSEQFSRLDLIRFYDMMSRTETELRTHPHPYIHLEMALITLVEVAGLAELEDVIGRMESGQTALSSSTAHSESPGFEAESRSKESAPAVAAAEAEKTAPGGWKSSLPVASGATQLRSLLQKENTPLYTLLEHAARLTFTGGKLSVAFGGAHTASHSIVNSAQNREVLEKLCAKIAGSAVEVEITLEQASEAPPAFDPEGDPRVKAFLETFPGKYTVHRKGED